MKFISIKPRRRIRLSIFLNIKLSTAPARKSTKKPRLSTWFLSGLRGFTHSRFIIMYS